MANKLINTIRTKSGDLQINYEALANKPDLGALAAKDKVSATDLDDVFTQHYEETIIALQVEKTEEGMIKVNYITGDGEQHTFEVEDDNTEYQLGTDAETGLTKLYAVTGSAEDGTMTQKAITTELNKKVGVTVDDDAEMLIFVK